MGNSPSSFLVTGKPVASFYYENTNQSVVVTRGSINIYNESTKEQINTMATRYGVNYAIQNEDLIITSEDDFFIRIYSINTGFLKQLPNITVGAPGAGTNDLTAISHKDIIKCLKVVEGNKILSASIDGTVRLWDILSGNLISIYLTHPQLISNGNNAGSNVPGISSIAYDEKRGFIFAGSSDGIIRKFSYNDRNIISQLQGHKRGAILNLVLIGSSGLLVSSSMDKTIRLWDIEKEKELTGSQYFAQVIVYDDHRDILFTANDEGEILIFKIERFKDQYLLKRLTLLDLKLPPILHISYNTYADIINVTCIEGNITALPNVTGISYKDRLDYINKQQLINNGELVARSPDTDNKSSESDDEIEEYLATHQDDQDQLKDISPEKIHQIIHELDQFKIKQSLELPMVDKENQMKTNLALNSISSIASELLNDNLERKNKLLMDFEKMKETTEELSDEYKECLQEIITSKLGRYAIDHENSKLAKELSIAQRRQLIIERHQRELQEFENSTKIELEEFDKKLPLITKKVANDFINNRDRFNQSQESIQVSMKQTLSSTFPNISDKYYIGGIISENSSTVFKGIDIENLKAIAVKVLPPGISLNPIKNENILSVHNIIETDQSIYIIQETCESNLIDYLKSYPDDILPIPIIKSIMKQLIVTLEALHSQSLVYRDLLPSKILLNNLNDIIDGGNIKVKLPHFGIMKSLLGSIESETPEENGMIFSPPEVFCKIISTESDIWSLGCIFLYLLQSKQERFINVMFTGYTSKEVIENIVKVVGRPFQRDLDDLIKSNESIQPEGIELLDFASKLPVPFDDCTDILKSNIDRLEFEPDALDLLNQMLKFTPQSRITLPNILNHRFFL